MMDKLVESALVDGVLAQVRAILKAEGMSQSQLAVRMGVSRSAVSHMMSGQRGMTIATLAKLGVALHAGLRIGLER